MTSVRHELTSAVGLLVAPSRQFGSFVDATAREGDALGDLTDRTGIATDALEGYAFMAKLAGTESQTMLVGIRKLETNLGQAANGSAESAQMFARLGIGIRDARGQLKSVDALLPEVSAAFQKLPNHAEKTAMAIKLFGRAGQELLPFLDKGPDAIAAMRKELEDLGGVSSQEFLDASSQYADNMDKLTVVWRGLRQAISGPIIRSINQAAEGFLAWWRAAGALMRVRIGEWAFQLTTSFDALWKMVSRFSTALIVLVAALNAPLLVMIGMKALIALLVDDFANWMAGNRSLIGIAIANWDNWIKKIGETHPVLASVMKFFGDFVQTVHDLIVEIGNDWEGFILKPITDTINKLKSFSLAEWIGNAKKELAFMGVPGFGLTAEAKAGEQRVLPNGVAGPAGALAGATSAAGSGATVNAPVNINVAAGPGMDEKALAEEVGKQFDMRMDAAMRQAFNAVVPEAH